MNDLPTLPRDDEARRALERIEAGLFRGSLPPSRFGRFIPLGRIGAGAMGTVYAAYDPELDRKVALKLIRTRVRVDADAARARLLDEARALARVSHPNVVPIYDVGTAGRDLFLAMELVEGATLDRWATTTPRTWRAVLSLLLPVARAVAAAHAAGIVHRDIKPQNILVGRDGRARVADFGLAAATADATTERALGDDESDELSLPSRAAGTVGYLAPELFGEAAGDAASDQFALCVTICETLYGERPFAGKTLTSYVTSLASPPRLPGAAGVPARVERILRRGLQRSAQQRFPSVAALADALQKVLERRGRLGALSAAAVAVAVAFVGGRALSGREPSPCESTASALTGVYDDEARGAIEAAFAHSTLPFSATASGHAVSALDRYADAWVTRRHEVCEAAHSPAPTPLALARAECLDARLSELEATVEILRAGGDETIARAAGLVELTPLGRCDDPSVRVDAPDAFDSELARVDVLIRADRLDEARIAAQSLLDAAKAGSHAAIEARSRVARARYEAYDYAGARPLYEQVTFAALAAGLDSVAAEAASRVLVLVGALAPDLDAVDQWRRLADTLATRSGDAGAQLVYRTGAGSVEAARQRFDEAREHYAMALQLAAIVHGSESLGVAETHHNLGVLELDAGDYDAATAALARAVEIKTREAGASHRTTILSRSTLAGAHVRRGDLQTALEQFERTLADSSAAVGDEDPSTMGVRSNLALAAARAGQTARALQLRREIVAHADVAWGASSRNTGMAHMNLATTEWTAGNREAGERHAERAVEIFASILEPDDPLLASARSNLGQMYVDAERFDDAHAVLREVVDSLERRLGPRHPELAPPLARLAECEAELGRDDLARVRLHWAMAVADLNFADNSPWRLPPRQIYGRFEASRQPEVARAVLEQAVAILDAGSDARPDIAADIELQLAELVWTQDAARGRALAERALARLDDDAPPQLRAQARALLESGGSRVRG